MNLVYLSTLIPKTMFDNVLNMGGGTYVVAPQKFHRLVVEGLIKNNQDIQVISYLPPELHYTSNMNEGEISYLFVNYNNIPGLKHLQIARGVVKAISVMINEGRKPDFLICDTLNVSVCLGALIASKKYRIKTVGIVTDILGMCSQEERGFINKIAFKVSNAYIRKFDRYILLTEQMNAIVNPNNRPFIIMEGLCDSKRTIPANSDSSRIKIFYAGGRPSKDGVDLLIKAFKMIKRNDLQLHLFGNIPSDISSLDDNDNRIFYHGIVDNDTVVKEELSSTILVNPRPTGELYTLYSFPSKIMEYMATGVPMITTKLPGIPDEYFDYVFTFESCDIESMKNTLETVIDMSPEVLINIGRKAQDFVLLYKSNVAQSKRIVDFLINN